MKNFSVVVCDTGAWPLGDSIPEDHAFFTGFLTCYKSGPEHHNLAIGEGGCVHRATTADGKTPGGKVILYSVTRLEDTPLRNRVMSKNNPMSAAIAKTHPDAEQDFYAKFWECKTLGEAFDLAMHAMHVEGRSRPFDKVRLFRSLERSLQAANERTSNPHHKLNLE